MFFVNSGARVSSEREELDIRRSEGVISVGGSVLISGELSISLVSQGSAFIWYSLNRFSRLLDPEDHCPLLLLFFFEEPVSWVETEGALLSMLARYGLSVNSSGCNSILHFLISVLHSTSLLAWCGGTIQL